MSSAASISARGPTRLMGRAGGRGPVSARAAVRLSGALRAAGATVAVGVAEATLPDEPGALPAEADAALREARPPRRRRGRPRGASLRAAA